MSGPLPKHNYQEILPTLVRMGYTFRHCSRELHVSLPTILKYGKRLSYDDLLISKQNAENARLRTGFKTEVLQNKDKGCWDWGYILGALLSDGCITKASTTTGWSLSLGVTDYSFVSMFRDCLQRLYGKRFNINKYQAIRTTYNDKPIYRVSTTNSYIIKDIIHEFGSVSNLRTGQECLPKCIDQEACFWGFMGGFIDGDGYLSIREKKGIELHLYSMSATLFKTMQERLLDFNMKSRITKPNIYVLSLYGKEVIIRCLTLARPNISRKSIVGIS